MSSSKSWFSMDSPFITYPFSFHFTQMFSSAVYLLSVLGFFSISCHFLTSLLPTLFFLLFLPPYSSISAGTSTSSLITLLINQSPFFQMTMKRHKGFLCGLIAVLSDLHGTPNLYVHPRSCLLKQHSSNWTPYAVNGEKLVALRLPEDLCIRLS